MQITLWDNNQLETRFRLPINYYLFTFIRFPEYEFIRPYGPIWFPLWVYRNDNYSNKLDLPLTVILITLLMPGPIPFEAAHI